MQCIHQQQLLVLLFVVESQLHEFEPPGVEVALPQGPQDREIHVVAELGHAGHVRAGDHAPLRPRLTFADRLVVAVEQVAERLVEHLVGNRIGQHELLEEPSGVGPVPLGRTGVGHRLHDLVLGAQSSGQGLGVSAHRTVGLRIGRDRGAALRRCV